MINHRRLLHLTEVRKYTKIIVIRTIVRCVFMAKVGRPKGTNNKNITVSMRMDKQTKERLEKYCEKMHVVKSEALRQAISLLTKDLED